MNFKQRIMALVIGLVFTAVGAVLTYFEFFGKGDQWYTDTSYFSYGTLITGIVLLLLAFERNKKKDSKDNNSPNKEEKDITV